MFKRRFLTAYLIIVAIFILVWGISLQVSQVKNLQLNYWFNVGYSILYLLAALISFRKASIFGFSDQVGKSFLYAGMGLTMYTAALWIWSYYNLYLNTELPYPSFADLFYSLFYPLILFSFWLFIKLFSISISSRLKIEASGVFWVTVFLAGGLLVPSGIKVDEINLTTFLNIFYPVADSLMIAFAFIGFRLSVGRLQLGFLMIILALVVQALGDLLFTYRSNIGIYWNGDISDLLFALGGFLFGLGMIHMTTSIAAHTEVIE